MKNKLYCLCLFLSIAASLNIPISCAEPFRDYFLIQISASSQYSDNAAKEYLNLDGVSERQDEYQLSLDGTYKNDWYVATAAYAFSDRQFSEASQPDETLVTGKGQLDLGESNQLLHLTVAHSSDSVLNAPDAIDISSNRLDRTLLRIEPSLRWRLNDIDILSITLRKLTVDYDKKEENNSKTKSIKLNWDKAISAIDNLLLEVESENIGFDIDPEVDYKLKTVSIGYSANLRKLSYRLAAGRSRATQGEEELTFSIPRYDINFAIKTAFNQFSLTSSQQINNSTLTSEFPSFSDLSFGPNNKALGVGLDLIKSRTIGANWESKSICNGCLLSVSSAKINDNYLRLNEKSISKNHSVSFAYSLSRDGVITVGYDVLDRFFAPESQSESLRSSAYQISYSHFFIDGFFLNCFVTKIKRKSNSLFSAVENIAGLELSYKL